MDLQSTFYVVGIICMSLILLLLVAGVVSVFVIRARLNAIHKMVEENVRAVGAIAGFGADSAAKIKNTIKHKD